ncbi:MAG: DUF4197 domain-containing protein [Bacteroidetes bacterium]|nr:DUF4197 domain-containing protein [Bacteroidota bacterium]
MKKYLLTVAVPLALLFSTACNEDGTLKDFGNGLSTDEVVAGLKEALTVGTDTSVTRLNRTDGYWQDLAVRILLPQQVQNVYNASSTIGLDGAFGTLLDDFQLKMNRAAENAADKAKPIIWEAITGITIADGWSILKGDSTAATNYLKGATYTSLVDAYLPDVTDALEEVGAQQAWSSITSTYNPLINTYNNTVAIITGNPYALLPTDLSRYVTEKALDGLFLKVSDEERRIRRDPIARVTDLLRRVFGQ